MNLTTGNFLWPTTVPSLQRYNSLERDITCEVAIIGAGDAGALCAWELMSAGFEVVLLERHRIGSGSSHANTGLLQFQNDMPLTEMAAQHGEQAAVQFYRRCLTSLQTMEDICNQLDVNPEFKRRHSLYYASSEFDAAPLEQEFKLLFKHRFPVEFMTRAEIRNTMPFEKPAAIWTTGDAEINPYRLVVNICQTLLRRGMQIYEDTDAVKLNGNDRGATITTHRGHQIHAKHVVVASGFQSEIEHPTPGAVLASSYALATEPLPSFPDWPMRCLIWETARPYLYMRTTSDNRVIIGGLDECHIIDGDARDNLLLEKTDALKQELSNLFPSLQRARVDFRWCGTFATSSDGLPFIGKHPSHRNTYLLLGYGGNGLMYYTLGAQLIRGLIVNGSHPDAQLLRPDRMRWYKAAASKVARLLT